MPAASYGNGTSGGAEVMTEFKSTPQGQPKRLHVSNIPFRFREPDLRQLFFVSFLCVLVVREVHVDAGIGLVNAMYVGECEVGKGVTMEVILCRCVN